MFMPMISGLCIANMLCDDKSSGYSRFEVIRTGCVRLKAAKYLSGVISSGIVTVVGFAAFSLFINSYFTKDDFVEINLAITLLEMLFGG